MSTATSIRETAWGTKGGAPLQMNKAMSTSIMKQPSTIKTKQQLLAKEVYEKQCLEEEE